MYVCVYIGSKTTKHNILSLITRRFCLNSLVHDHRGRSLKFDAQFRGSLHSVATFPIPYPFLTAA